MDEQPTDSTGTRVPATDLTTTQLKLQTTPTAGVSGEQSPYSRRLITAGYKGFLQGTVGGGTLYGTIGAIIGGLVALPLIPAAGIGALALIPAMGGLGLYKGASTFGNISSVAAITAESAEMSEKRRYLLDRYYDLPDSPEYDAEAQQIRDLLAKQHESKAPESMFHWRTVAVGALLGAAVALLFTVAAPGTAAIAAEAIGGHFIFGGALGVESIAAVTGLTTLVGTALGALTGGMIGLDRYYVRNWLDKSANLLNDNRHIEDQVRERQQEVASLGRNSGNIKGATVTEIKQYLPPAPPQTDEAMKIHVMESAAEAPSVSVGAAIAPQGDVEQSHPHGSTRHLPIDPHKIAGIETNEAPAKPSASASAIDYQNRIQQAAAELTHA